MGLKQIPTALKRSPLFFIPRTSNLWKWLVPLSIGVIAILFFAIKSNIQPLPIAKVDTIQIAKSIAQRQSEIIVKLPAEAELFVSANAYRSRSELDQALSLGFGQRYLPDTVQQISMDSLSLAKGVYGYFKVNNNWRKGKLIETFQHSDTIRIVKFLDPLY